MLMLSRSFCVASVMSLMLMGCDALTKDDEDQGSEEGHNSADGGGHDPDADTADDEATDERDAPCTSDYPRFEPDLSVTAGDLTVRVVSVAPEPPRQKTPNDWVVQLEDAAGEPVDGATLSNPASYMEVHRHYGKTPPVVQVQKKPGQFKLDNIDFKMRGPWEVLFDVELESGEKQPVSIKICVE